MKLDSLITFAAIFVLLVIYTPILILLFGWMLVYECARWAMRDKHWPHGFISEYELHRALNAEIVRTKIEMLELEKDLSHNDKVSDGGPLTHESKQDANPPFVAPLG